MGRLCFQKVPIWQNWMKPGDKVSYFSVSKESEGILSSVFFFCFPTEWYKGFLLQPMDWIQGFSRACLALAFHVFEHRSKNERRREQGMLPPTSHSKPERWMLRIQQADVRDSRSRGYAVSCWDRSRWKGLWLSGTAKGLGLFPCKALLGEAFLGSWLFFLSTDWLAVSDMLDDRVRLRSWSYVTRLHGEHEVGTAGWASWSHGRD